MWFVVARPPVGLLTIAARGLSGGLPVSTPLRCALVSQCITIARSRLLRPSASFCCLVDVRPAARRRPPAHRHPSRPRPSRRGYASPAPTPYVSRPPRAARPSRSRSARRSTSPCALPAVRGADCPRSAHGCCARTAPPVPAPARSKRPTGPSRPDAPRCARSSARSARPCARVRSSSSCGRSTSA